ncbi:hypothetical protein AVEN_98148-1 [Araneus ventricosus]|uniref:Uncharacterized protein n=1 Tax=Araneus ventricosus TaxID=182803 RepID=A0A4Y2MR75_ARAVE|nr:hypothetical protein AVEN_98148-1 [Araneus ventricosus]
MESRFPAMSVLWLGKEFYRGKYEMTNSSHVWTPDLGDHLGDKFGNFGDEIWDLKGAGIFSISLLAEQNTVSIDYPGFYQSRPLLTEPVLENRTAFSLMPWWPSGKVPASAPKGSRFETQLQSRIPISVKIRRVLSLLHAKSYVRCQTSSRWEIELYFP